MAAAEAPTQAPMSPTAEPILTFDHVSRRYGPQTALRDVSLELHAGELVAAIGPNGGGKSTLLLLAAGLLAPSAGTVTVCGIPAHRLAQERTGWVGLVTARPGLYPLLSGWENLEHFAGLCGLPTPEARAQAQPLLDELHLTPDAMDRPTRAWSTGMQQKLSLVRALLLKPRLLLFDEPTANLDPVAAHAITRALRQRADAGLACLLVTHDLPAAEALCDRALLIQGAIRRTLAFPRRDPPPPGPLLAAWTETLTEPA